MELKDFIKRALLDIVNGVDEANLEQNRFRLANHINNRGTSGQKVEFDVSVIINETSESDTKGGIKVALVNLGAGIGAGKKEIESNQNVHKIKFEVFVHEK